MDGQNYVDIGKRPAGRNQKMSNNTQHLKSIQEKLQLLLKNHAALQKENRLLKIELEKAILQSGEQQKNVEDLKQQVGILKMGAGEMNSADKKEFEKKLNAYIKEIDKCIALLSK